MRAIGTANEADFSNINVTVQIIINYEAGRSAKADVGSLPSLTDPGYVDWNWRMAAGTSFDVWAYTMANCITEKDAANHRPIWQSLTSDKITTQAE